MKASLKWDVEDAVPYIFQRADNIRPYNLIAKGNWLFFHIQTRIVIEITHKILKNITFAAN